MIRRPSIALLILVAGAFFLIGLYTALLGAPGAAIAPATQPPSLPVTAAPTETPAKTVLILGVDTLTAELPQLRAIWFLTVHPPASDVFLLGVSPVTAALGEATGSLADAFALTGDDSPSQAFLDALFRTIPLPVDELVVLDESAFAGLIDFVGGVTLNEAAFTGDAILGVLSLTAEDPEADLQLQRSLLQAMSVRAGALGDSPEITPLVEQMPEHAYISAGLTDMVGLLAPVLPLSPDAIHIELY